MMSDDRRKDLVQSASSQAQRLAGELSSYLKDLGASSPGAPLVANVLSAARELAARLQDVRLQDSSSEQTRGNSTRGNSTRGNSTP